jgi:hypothetical protein
MYIAVLRVVFEIISFLILATAAGYILKKIKGKSYKILNPQEYIPEEEIHSLKQMFYLIMMGLFFINIMYSMTFVETEVPYIAIFDIALSLFLAVTLDKSSIKNKILILVLVPYGSMTFFLYGHSLIGLLDLIHVPVFIYFIKVYFDKFKEYTESNSLGIAIILLFTIVFISFIFTQIVETENPLDSLVMVSNAFTSNGYSVLGTTIPGKLNSLVLVWSGYILSGVGTATLTAALLIKHFNKKFEKLEKMIEEKDKD